MRRPPSFWPSAAQCPESARPWRRWLLPFALAAGVALAAPAGAADPLQSWLAARLDKHPGGAGAKEERALFAALLRTGHRSVERYVLARAIHRGDGGRNDVDPLVPELDEAALAAVLHEMPAYRRLLARVKAHPGQASAVVEVPGARHPQAIGEAIAPETSNELLEAMRSTPPSQDPPRREEIDVVAELPAIVALLGEEPVKSRVVTQLYRERPQVFAGVFQRHRADPAFRGALERALGRSYAVLLRESLDGVVRELRAQLARNGFPQERLRLLAAENPEALEDIVAAHLRAVGQHRGAGGWRFGGASGGTTARIDAGHFAFTWKLAAADLAVGSEVMVPADATVALLARCHGELCLP